MKFRSFRKKLIEIAGVIGTRNQTKRKHAIDLLVGKGLSMADITAKYGPGYLKDVLSYTKKIKNKSLSKNIIARIKHKLK